MLPALLGLLDVVVGGSLNWLAAWLSGFGASAHFVG